MRWMWLATCPAGLIASPLLGAQDFTYLQSVRPILDKNCIGCHQPDRLAARFLPGTHRRLPLFGGAQ